MYVQVYATVVNVYVAVVQYTLGSRAFILPLFRFFPVPPQYRPLISFDTVKKNVFSAVRPMIFTNISSIFRRGECQLRDPKPLHAQPFIVRLCLEMACSCIKYAGVYEVRYSEI